MVLEQTDYRQILRESLSLRCAANPRYSLRAFARDLKLSPGQLSLILGGSKGLSPAKADRVAKSLSFNDRETQYFRTLVESAHGRSLASRASAVHRLKQFTTPVDAQRLEIDAFRVVSDWYHFAIHQMMRLEDWNDSPTSIAKRLQIPVSEAKAALERLERLQLIEKRRGRYAICSETVFAPDGVPSEAVRKFHRQVLENAARALSEQDIERRYFNTSFLAINANDLPRAKARIKDFHQKMMDEFSPDKQTALNRVYSLSVQFFDLLQQPGGKV